MLVTRRAANHFRAYANIFIAKTIIPLSFQPYSTSIKNHYANTLNGVAHLHGFGCKGFRCFSHISSGDENEDGISSYTDREDGDDDDDDCNDHNNSISSNKTPMWTVVYSRTHCDTNAALDEWVKQGNVVTKAEYDTTMNMLIRRVHYRLAYDVSLWVATKKPFGLDEVHYATHLKCILYTQNLFAARKYFESIPSYMKGLRVYRALLKGFIRRGKVRDAEVVFRKMKNSGFEVDLGDYNSMLFLYCSCARSKIARFLESMKASNVKPNAATYRNLIQARGLTKDVGGMIEDVKKMKAEGLKPDAETLSILARQYIKSAMAEKADEVISELEALSNLVEHKGKRYTILRNLLLCYALLNKENEVQRHWNEIESGVKKRLEDYMVGITAWGKLGKIGMAEKIFDSLLGSRNRVLARPYNALLQVYAEHSLQSKAEELLEKMSKNGLKMNRPIRSTLVILYANLGDLQKAESMLSDDYGDKKIIPAYRSFLLVLQKHAEKGDIKNAEKIFDAMKQAGYKGKYKMYAALLHAYVKANTRAYGIRGRMWKDYFYPDEYLKSLLKQVSEFEKEPERESP